MAIVAQEAQQAQALSIIDNVNLQQVSATMQKIAQFQAVVQKTLKKDHDYGVIPGTGNKPTLLKPGAEKILMLMGLTSEYEIIERIQDYEKGFFAFTIKCQLSKNSIVITEGFGHANTKEARYDRRWVTESKLPPGTDKSNLQGREKDGKYGKYFEYLVENDDPYTLVNTVLKMAKKRAQVDAVLTVASLSEIFTQDLEDYGDVLQQQPRQPRQTPRPAASNNIATNAQLKAIFAKMRELGIKSETAKQIVNERYGISDSRELTKKGASDLIEYLTKLESGEETWPPEPDDNIMDNTEEVENPSVNFDK